MRRCEGVDDVTSLARVLTITGAFGGIALSLSLSRGVETVQCSTMQKILHML